jgi:hypothetical protein
MELRFRCELRTAQQWSGNITVPSGRGADLEILRDPIFVSFVLNYVQYAPCMKGIALNHQCGQITSS